MASLPTCSSNRTASQQASMQTRGRLNMGFGCVAGQVASIKYAAHRKEEKATGMPARVSQGRHSPHGERKQLGLLH